MSKKNKIKNTKVYSSDQDEMMRMIKVLGSVVIVLVAFYLIFSIASGEISFGGSKKKKDVSIQNVEILAGNSFSRSESTYYVLMYDFDKDDSIIYSNIYDIFRNSSSEKMYVVDLNKKFNSRFITEDSSLVDISSIDKLKVVNGTLIKIENGVATSKAIGKDEINDLLFTLNA